MSGFKFDPTPPGLRKILKNWEERALRFMWEVGEEGAGSGTIWKNVNEQLVSGDSISRASVIFFMNRLVEQKILSFREGIGRGGHHKIYYPLIDEKGSVKRLIKIMIESLTKDSPEDSKAVYLAYLDVWEKEIDAVDDPDILEPALDSPETTDCKKTRSCA